MSNKFHPIGKLHLALFGYEPHPNTALNWTRVGRRINGQRRTLKFVKIGRKYFTTEEWLRDFVEVQAGVNDEPKPPTSRQLSRAQTEAERLCESLGV